MVSFVLFNHWSFAIYTLVKFSFAVRMWRHGFIIKGTDGLCNLTHPLYSSSRLVVGLLDFNNRNNSQSVRHVLVVNGEVVDSVFQIESLRSEIKSLVAVQ